MFDYSGAYGSPIRRRIYQDPNTPEPPTFGNDALPSMLDSVGDGSAGSPIVVGGDPSLHLSTIQPRRNKWLSFLGSAQRGGGIAGGLSGLAGQGGVAGGIGKIAQFLL